MNEPLFVFIALAGSALLGFIFSVTLARRRTNEITAKNIELASALKEANNSIERLQMKYDSKVIAVDSLQKISQDIENQVVEKNEELKLLRSENIKLQEEIHHFTENPIEKIREIDVIREVPVLIFREINMPESRIDKAKKLMKAFTKGYLDENGLLQEVVKQEIADKED
ncbi:MAG: hypothetical protein K9J37_05270 [Saprospiraceae bacterium]|nr:hypothetical protein [Saprospiraceae bacterium]MCF8249299.1 hypothetical protein [Saprospiraceae bacterium]MCF8279720.1 hypothetical protein [Bacteroidales bacterium]MCF8311424.1 hypothetical protein [Saprospiraceae bacterium]MCF8439918.1 hypothetical protein [Saprospiraceae bacterium]